MSTTVTNATNIMRMVTTTVVDVPTFFVLVVWLPPCFYRSVVDLYLFAIDELRAVGERFRLPTRCVEGLVPSMGWVSRFLSSWFLQRLFGFFSRLGRSFLVVTKCAGIVGVVGPALFLWGFFFVY